MLLLLLLPDCLKELRRQMEYLQIANTDDGFIWNTITCCCRQYHVLGCVKDCCSMFLAVLQQDPGASKKACRRLMHEQAQQRDPATHLCILQACDIGTIRLKSHRSLQYTAGPDCR